MSKTYSAAERAYREIKERILTGALPGGELISEGEIATDLGTSRTPVREAFLRLETEGWMRLYPKRGALVVPIPSHEAEHVAHARYVVETAAVRALTADDRPALIDALRDSLTRQRELVANLAASDGRALSHFATEDTDFHRGYVVAAGNPLLTGFYDSLRERQRRMNSVALHRAPMNTARIVEQHAQLTDLIAAGDTAGFDTALAEHLSGVHQLELRGL
ncbi:MULTISPECIES: GntR family transcriptional regulator [Nocardia]|uniref:GntR family transcriptional regulator n=2 Tax=Nocardia TaxID=1817 RepID=A0A2T2YXG8_9NOCA|nr:MULTISPECIES: GntR family transcriptional regulator [Nocardia]MBF6243429.1 GntR family transcriptional regulator [Nocardia elegans]MBF6450497.1 GntR family transcriptional regulator [Nocardia elegans]PSR60190.1 GntR family transcriptional regulator [Nocardia nova]